MKEAFRVKKEAFQRLLREKEIRVELFILFQGKEVPPWKEVEEEISGVLKRLEDALNSENGPSALGAGGS